MHAARDWDAVGARSREPRAKIFAAGEILLTFFVLHHANRRVFFVLATRVLSKRQSAKHLLQMFCGFAANTVCNKTTTLAVEQNSELSEAKHILPRVTKRNKSELFRKSKLVRIYFLLLTTQSDAV